MPSQALKDARDKEDEARRVIATLEAGAAPPAADPLSAQHARERSNGTAFFAAFWRPLTRARLPRSADFRAAFPPAELAKQKEAAAAAAESAAATNGGGGMSGAGGGGDLRHTTQVWKNKLMLMKSEADQLKKGAPLVLLSCLTALQHRRSTRRPVAPRKRSDCCPNEPTPAHDASSATARRTAAVSPAVPFRE